MDAAAGILSADSLEGTLAGIAHHLGTLVPYDDLSLYEIEAGGTALKPVFAVGNWVEEIMAEEIPLLSGVTGWVVRNRRTRNVPNTQHDPLCSIVPGTDDSEEAFVAVPLVAHDRVVGSLNVYRSGPDVPFSADEVALVERFATMAALAYDSARQRHRLREEVRTDSLTGLLNHRGCQERLRAALADADGEPVSVVVIDLDHFKRINDTHGHAEGDRALAAVAASLRAVVRDTDAVGRLGGEEFVLLLPGVEAGAAREAAERARLAIADVQVDGRPLACSAGLACYPQDAADAGRPAGVRGRRAVRRQGHRPRPHLPLPRRARPPPLAGRGARGDRGAAARPRMRSPPSSSPCSSSPPAACPATRRSPGSPPSRSARRTSGSRRPIASASAPSSRRPRCAPRSPSPGRPEGTFLALNVSPRALASPLVLDALPADLSSIVVELTEHDLFGAEETLALRLAAAARPRRADRARRRRLGLRRPAAADLRRPRHPQARPLARARRPRATRPSSRCWRR